MCEGIQCGGGGGVYVKEYNVEVVCTEKYNVVERIKCGGGVCERRQCGRGGGV